MKHNILEGANFARLSRNSIASPIHLLNNILEDSKQKNKELCVLFQDICKAFDSVELKILKKALIRIKLPEGIISLIMSLFERRKIKVITSFGLTEEFETEDSLDQGEVISPLA